MSSASLRRVVDMGVHPGLSAVDTRHVRTANIVSLLAAGILSLWALVLAGAGAGTCALEFAVAAGASLAVPLLNRWGRQTASVAYLLLLIHVQVAVSLVWFGFGSGASLFYFFVVLAPYLLFHRADRRLAVAFSGLGGLAWIGSTWARDLLPPRVEVLEPGAFALLNTVLVVGGLLVVGLTTEAVLDSMADALEDERARADRLLLNVLPPSIAERLKRAPDAVIADRFEEVTILFADLVGFTPLSARLSAERTVALLNEVFTEFDRLCDEAGVEKIRTIGDGYMAVCGAPLQNPDHALVVARVAVQMLDFVDRLETEEPLQVRIGVNTGAAVAAIVGTSRFHFDLWGDAVNVAARMESLGEPGRVHIARPTWERIHHLVPCESRGPVEVKGKGTMNTWFIARAVRPSVPTPST